MFLQNVGIIIITYFYQFCCRLVTFLKFNYASVQNYNIFALTVCFKLICLSDIPSFAAEYSVSFISYIVQII
jgi:hypothetical protein